MLNFACLNLPAGLKIRDLFTSAKIAKLKTRQLSTNEAASIREFHIAKFLKYLKKNRYAFFSTTEEEERPETSGYLEL